MSSPEARYWEHHAGKAAELLGGQVRYYNGGQTVRHEDPTPQEVERAKAHAALAQVLLAAELAGEIGR